MNLLKTSQNSLVAIVVAASILFASCNYHSTTASETTVVQEQNTYNHHPSHIKYSKHAKCRMECRHIDETEIKEVIEHGEINYKKSNLQNDDCHKRYAVEGFSKEQQHLRIIVAGCNDDLTVITCIDLGKEFECHCPGDEK